MTTEKKLALLAEVFECEAEDLNAELLLEDFEDWNSMTKLSLIVLMDDEFHKTLTTKEIDTFKTIGDIIGYMG